MTDRFETFTVSVFKITHYWSKIAAEEMKACGLKGAYALYVVTLSNHDGELTAAALAKLCGRDKADVSRAVRTMQKKGILKPYEKGAYRAPLVFTPEGKKLASLIRDRAVLAFSLAGEGLTDEEREGMYTSFEKINENLRILSEEGVPSKN